MSSHWPGAASAAPGVASEGPSSSAARRASSTASRASEMQCFAAFRASRSQSLRPGLASRAIAGEPVRRGRRGIVGDPSSWEIHLPQSPFARGETYFLAVDGRPETTFSASRRRNRGRPEERRPERRDIAEGRTQRTRLFRRCLRHHASAHHAGPVRGLRDRLGVATRVTATQRVLFRTAGHGCCLKALRKRSIGFARAVVYRVPCGRGPRALALKAVW
jgi:hypothetical protein